jgi:hypothetical protein
MKGTIIFCIALLFAYTLAESSNYEPLVFDQGACYVARGIAITGHRFPNGTEVRNAPVNATLAINTYDRLYSLNIEGVKRIIVNETHAYLYSQKFLDKCTPVPTDYLSLMSDMAHLLKRGLHVSVTNNFRNDSSTTADLYNVYYSLIRSVFDCNLPVAMIVGQSPLTYVLANGGYNVYLYSEREVKGGPSGNVVAYDEISLTSVTLECITEYDMIIPVQCHPENIMPFTPFCGAFFPTCL